MALQAIKYTPAEVKSSARLEILDQLLLPHQSTYIDVANCEDGYDAIKQMKVRGAPAIAIVAALALAVELSRTQPQNTQFSTDKTRSHVVERLQYLKKSRPTAVNLSDAINKLSRVVFSASSQSDATPQSVVKA